MYANPGGLPHPSVEAEDLAQTAELMAQHAQSVEEAVGGNTAGQDPHAAAADLKTEQDAGTVQRRIVDLGDFPTAGAAAPAPSAAAPGAAAVTQTGPDAVPNKKEDPAAAGDAPADPIFVNIVERKENAGGKPPKSYRSSSGHGHNYVIKFFLVDNHGKQYLAATGVDHGDSHYEYTNETGFPFLCCHNKMEVKRWADGIIARSQERGGFHTDVIRDEIPPEGTQVSLPKFISYWEKKEELQDGRHLLKWFLLDTEGHSHLALVGEEKDTRDGHYIYHTEAIFQYAKPLEAKNQEDVKKWLDSMLLHPQQGMPVPSPAAAVGGGSSGARGGGSAGHRSGTGGGGAVAAPPVAPMALRTAAQRASRPSYPPRPGLPLMRAAGGRFATPGGRRGRGRGRGPGRPPRPSIGPGSAGARFSGPEALVQKSAGAGMIRRGRSGWKVIDPDRDARDLVAAELRRWAQEEAVRRETIKNEALAYSNDEMSEEDAAVVQRVLPLLHAAAQGKAVLPKAGSAGTAEQRKSLVATLGALREVSHLRSTLDLVAVPGLKSTVAALAQHPHPDVSALSASTLEGWLRAAVAQISILAEPRYVQNPRPVLDSLIADRGRFDPVVMAITHRTLRSPEMAPLPVPGGLLSAGALTPGTTGGLTPDAQGTPSTSGMAFGEMMTDGGLSGIQDGSGAEDVEDIEDQEMDDDDLGEDEAEEASMRQKVELENAPSAALVDVDMGQQGDEGAQILPPFEQHLAQEGCEF